MDCTTDWNWFFSSLAQSAASITGMFGAFIIAKILSNQADFSGKKNRLKELLAVAEKIKGNVDATLSSNNKYIKENTPLDDWENVEMKKTIKSLKIDVHHQIRLISNFLESIESSPESSSGYLTFAIIIVFVLFYFGVFWPLKFLPTPDDWVPPVLSSHQIKQCFVFPMDCNPLLFEITFPRVNDIKNIMLQAFFYIFSFILGFFLTMNTLMQNIMRRSADDVEKLKLFKFIENYASEAYADYWVSLNK